MNSITTPQAHCPIGPHTGSAQAPSLTVMGRGKTLGGRIDNCRLREPRIRIDADT